MNGLSLGVDYGRLMFGENAVHVPAMMWVQNAGDGLVSFVGASKVDGGLHPLRYGSTREHQLIRGELLVRPHQVVATDTTRGAGLSDLLLGHHLDEVMAHGEYLIGGAS